MFSILNYHREKDTVIITLKENKYKISGFKSATGVYNETEDTIYYLAYFKIIKDVSINSEAKYFILNNDNTYQITKITEIPKCKYIAPIIGRSE